MSKIIDLIDSYIDRDPAAKGRIEDADFAAETASLTKSQILNQAATSMLAQANANGDVFLRLIN